MTNALRALLAPKSVAVIGASDDPARIGGRPVSYLVRAGFPGPIWPVNPNREIVQGLRAYPSVADVPGAPDACIIAVAAPLVPETLEACADRGAKAAVILSAGFAEAGEEGRRAQERISRIAQERDIRVLGPNTLGLFNAHERWMGTFASTVLHGTPEPGPIGVASQSGAVGSELFDRLRRRGLHTGIWITTGNEADIDLADALAYLADDPRTRIIVAYAEGVRDGPAMRSALIRASEAGKPVIFLKSGRSEVGARAVEAHTAAVAGSDRVYDALFRQFGAVRVGNAEELVDAAYAAARAPLPAGRRLLILTISGGAGVQMADAAADLGLTVPAASSSAQEKLKALVPFAGVGNPVDTTAQIFNDVGLIGQYLRILMDDGDYDAIALFLTSVAASEEVAGPLVAELDAARARFPGVPLVVSLAAPPELTRPYTDAGYALFEEPTRAVRAVSLLGRLAEAKRRKVVASASEVPQGALSVVDCAPDGPGAVQLLESWGIRCLDRSVPLSDDEGIDAVVRVARDATFGPAVTVGLAGVLTEVLDDVVFRLVPFDVDEARRMIAESTSARLLDGTGGRPELDAEALAELLAKVSALAHVEADTIRSLELDPVRVLPRGEGVVVLDAAIVRSGEGVSHA